eukprot:8609165-Alexandrium_andersonii.AAC.1
MRRRKKNSGHCCCFERSPNSQHMHSQSCNSHAAQFGWPASCPASRAFWVAAFGVFRALQQLQVAVGPPHHLSLIHI